MTAACPLPSSYAVHANPQHALSFKLCGESFSYVPKSVIIDGLISYGGSTGVGLNLPAKAYSEFFERNHLFTHVPITGRARLDEIKPTNYRKALSQWCGLKRVSDSHTFSWTQVHNLFDDKPYDFFYNGISLNGDKRDNAYLDYTDSCSCAAHPDKDGAIYNSLMEFIERQALLGSWMTGRVRYAINPDVLKVATPYQQLVQQLLTHGELYIFENGLDLPGHTVIMFYFAKSPKDSVQYSIGSSSGLSLEEALTSALVELYQCYTFLYNTESSKGLEDKAGSGYHLKFQQCNHQGSREVIPFLSLNLNYQIDTVEDVVSAKKFEFNDVVAELAEFSRDIYYYHHHEPTLNLHFSKLIALDYFPHMDIQRVSVDNAYAKSLGINRDNAYTAPIPFP